MSTNSPTLRSTLALAAALAVALLLPGCGGGYGVGPAGTLAVENDPGSFFDIDAFEIQAGIGPVEHYDVGLGAGDGFSLAVYPDDYDVQLFWSDGSSDLFFVTVFDDSTTTVTGVN
jgi:hypothetical protein